MRVAERLRLAGAVGVVGGLVLGAREALVAAQANAFVQPGQYLALYLSVPILAWMVLAVALLVPMALLPLARTPRRAFSLFAVVLGFAGGLSIAWPWCNAVTDRLRDVGEAANWRVTAAVWVTALGLAGGAAAVIGAAAAWYAARVARPFHFLSRCALLAALLLLWPPLRFFATDWVWGVATHSSAPPLPSQPNIVLISIDTLRADHLGCYGDTHGLTPHLDHFAHEGVLFEQTITSAPWTLPAMASLFTGQNPHHHGAGVITNRRDPLGRSALPAEGWRLTTALRDRGYRTQAIVTNPYLALRYGLGSGFDGYENVTIESEAFLAFSDTTAVRLLRWRWPDLIVGDRGETVSDRGVRWLTRNSQGPFFLWLHYIDPHPPYSRAGVTHHKSFRGDTSFASDGRDPAPFALTSPDVARLRSGEIRLSAEQKEAVRDLYRAEVASVDAAVGQVLAALDAQGLRERTLVVVVADHGEEFWEHGGVEHGHTVYEELIHVPLLIRWPGHLPAETRVAPVVRIVDVAPTILDLLGIAPPSDLDGATLRGLTQAPAVPTEGRLALVENMLFAEERSGLRTDQFKYVRWENGKEEVYWLANDPHEQRDLAGNREAIKPLRELHMPLAGTTALAPRGTAPVDDGGAEAALRALGYLR
ncbi:MAG: sulfatase [Deltaproteobacteria bacterium]|nr:sulfatase [Deltaproteobacteria bacterium]MBI3390020.1 sulfatase [Deltaproteobacteria bacterium]